MTKWEYKITSVEANAHGHVVLDEAYLNQLGQEGWELIELSATHSILRRPVEPTPTKPVEKPAAEGFMKSATKSIPVSTVGAPTVLTKR